MEQALRSLCAEQLAAGEITACARAAAAVGMTDVSDWALGNTDDWQAALRRQTVNLLLHNTAKSLAAGEFTESLCGLDELSTVAQA